MILPRIIIACLSNPPIESSRIESNRIESNRIESNQFSLADGLKFPGPVEISGIRHERIILCNRGVYWFQW
jgi:hypothetical protein